MEELLRKLFDYQKFEENLTLKKMTEAGTIVAGMPLEDDELELASAAGDLTGYPSPEIPGSDPELK